MRGRRVAFVLVGLAVLGLFLAGCSAQPAAPGAQKTEAKWPETIALGGYPEASDSYPYNVGIAKVISDNPRPKAW